MSLVTFLSHDHNDTTSSFYYTFADTTVLFYFFAGSLNCSAFVAGIIEAVLNGCNFVSISICLFSALFDVACARGLLEWLSLCRGAHVFLWLFWLAACHPDALGSKLHLTHVHSTKPTDVTYCASVGSSMGLRQWPFHNEKPTLDKRILYVLRLTSTLQLQLKINPFLTHAEI